MAIKSREEIMEAIKARIGEDTSDEAISFLEDVKDTLDDMQKKATPDSEDWKKKYEENDAQWRQRYKDRFFSGSDTPPETDVIPPEPEDKPIEHNPETFDELFSAKEK